MPAYRTTVRHKGTHEICVRIVYLLRRRHSAPILRVILSHGGEGRELPEDPHCVMATRERPERADKNGAPLVPQYTPRHTTRHHRTACRPASHIDTPRCPHHGNHAPPPRNATTTRRHPTRTTERTRREQTAATRTDETTRELELTKTAQQDKHQHETPDNTERSHETRSGTPTPTRQAKRRYENANQLDTNGTPIRDERRDE